MLLIDYSPEDNTLHNHSFCFLSVEGVHVRWIHYHHSMALPQVADGGNVLQLSRVAALNKQPWTDEKGWSYSFGVGCGANLSLQKRRLLRKFITSLRLEQIL
jgi:hypothetical protein